MSTQTSLVAVQSWRANCDIQFLIYQTDPECVDTDDVAHVVNYVIAYACKGNEKEIDSKKSIRSLILNTKEDFHGKADVKRVARKILNDVSKMRMISRQEALCQLGNLRLWECSDDICIESIAGNVRLGTNGQAKRTFLSRYATQKGLDSMTLDQYFYYQCFQQGIHFARNSPSIGAGSETSHETSHAGYKDRIKIHSESSTQTNGNIYKAISTALGE